MKILPSYEFGSFGTSNGEVLPIADWADGRIRELTHGTDFNCSPITLSVKLRKFAKANGMRVRIAKATKGSPIAVIQFIKDATPATAPAAAPKAKGKTK